jgi:hypothetical protein
MSVSPSHAATIACGPEDLLRALVGMCCMHDQPGWQASVLRLVGVFIDGLRIRPKRPRARAKQRKRQS